MRPAGPGEQAQFLITPTKSGKTVTSLAQENKITQEQQDAKEKSDKAAQIIKDSAQDMLDTIGEVEKGIDYFGLTGPIWAIPGTKKTVWEANVNKLLSGKILDLMTSLKEASKTGATGFGQLSNKELAVLERASTALKKGLPRNEAKKILENMKTNLAIVVQGRPEGNGQKKLNDPLGIR